MKIDVRQPLTMLSGEPITLPNSDELLSLRWACREALLAHNPKEEADATEKMRRFKLSWRIENNDSVDLSAEEIAMLKKLLAQHLTTLVAAQAALALERKKLDKNGNEVGIDEGAKE